MRLLSEYDSGLLSNLRKGLYGSDVISIRYVYRTSPCSPLWLVVLGYPKTPVYLFSSLAPLQQFSPPPRWQKFIMFLTRLGSLVALCFALARFQTPDERSKIPVQGVDIMLVLDTYKSLMIFDDPQDRRTRLDVARDEALRFIDKRENDPIGLVIFSRVSVSRCPLLLIKVF